MTTKYLTGLMLLMVACSGGQTTSGGEGAGRDELKKAAAEARSNPSPSSSSSSSSGDVCAKESWYGDGQCDTFCQDADSQDCTPNSGGVFCAEFIEQSNGFCSRRIDDPCISQDPDCADVTDPGGAVCPAIAQLPDGVCKDDPNDRCAYWGDPDCGAGSDPVEPTEPIYCTDIARPLDGICKDDPSDPCDVYQDPDCHGGIAPTDPGVPVCKAVPEPSDGVCGREPNDPCLTADPDCVPAVACAEYLEQPNGVCERKPNDPCIFQDPDCHVK